jgi:hypothetical protein
MALGMRNTAGDPTHMFFTPVFDAPAGKVRLTFQYLCEFTGRGGVLVRFMPKKPEDKPAIDIQRLPGGGGTWQTAVVEADLKGSTGGLFEFHSHAGERNKWIWIRAVKIVDPTAPTPVAAAAPAADFGTPLYAFDAGSLRPGRYTVENRQFQGDNFFPEGFLGHCWKAESITEFRSGEAAGGKAFGITNLNDTLSSQVLVYLESQLGAALAPGREYRVRVGYRAANDAEGKAMIREPGPSYKALGEAALTRGGDGWKTADFTFRKDSDKKLEILIENSAVGEGNTLWVRQIEVFESK